MTALGSALDIRPLTRLVVGLRGLSVLAVSICWGFGIGWFGFMLRYNWPGNEVRTSDAEFFPLFFAAALVSVPATCGILCGEAAQEVLRRPAPARLPGIRRALFGAARTLAVALAVVALLGAYLLRGTLSVGPLFVPAAASLAFAGFAMGLWIMVRIGSAWGWVWRAAVSLTMIAVSGSVLAMLAGADSSTATAGVLCLALTGLALVAIRVRFSARVWRATYSGGVPTLFSGFLPSPENREVLRRNYAAKNKNDRLPLERLGGSLAGWGAARRYELNTLNGLGRPLAFVPMCLILLGIGCAFVVARTLFDGGTGDGRLAAVLGAVYDAIVGGPERTVDGRGTQMMLAMYGALTAGIACTTLSKTYFHPIGRALRARLALRTCMETTAIALTTLLVLAGALVLTLGLILDRPWPDHLPLFVRIVLFIVIIAPWLQIAVHAAAFSRFPEAVAIGLPAMVAVLAVDICNTAGFARPTWPLMLLGALAIFGSWFTLARFLERQMRTADLTPAV